MAYTYLLRFIPDGRVYYGVRYRKGCHPDELLVDYFTSSKEVKSLIEAHGVGSFEKEIRRVFSSPDKAKAWETKVLTRMDVINNDGFINKSNNKPYNGYDAPLVTKTPQKRKRSEIVEKESRLHNFDFESWREHLAVSKLAAARMMGLDKNVYNKYEAQSLCPKYVKMAAIAISIGVRLEGDIVKLGALAVSMGVRHS
jgi:DNA-binding transcriptional regulator YiaG